NITIDSDNDNLQTEICNKHQSSRSPSIESQSRHNYMETQQNQNLKASQIYKSPNYRE
ncbi:2454_t:CDS:1, partial [Racocetra fulgida]